MNAQENSAMATQGEHFLIKLPQCFKQLGSCGIHFVTFK